MNAKKLSLVCFSGDFDKAVAVFTLASGAAAVGWEVNIFFTFWGLNVIRKNKGRAFTGQSFMARAFNFLMGGRKHLPLSRFNFAGISPVLMTGMMKGHNVATLEELIDSAKALGVKLYACEMAMNILEIKKEELDDDVVDIIGVPTFLEQSQDAQTLFI
ncbi:MAG: DsrE/DsrF/DrsH-like family protein [Nitrospinae bacterium]|nr:DsrE/DsrF/DrsH-like family protein [Nitrospinota bacterium]